eukprot:scaffold363_cov255-Pinguiococcus_pyrenoidosus.AAC.11
MAKADLISLLSGFGRTGKYRGIAALQQVDTRLSTCTCSGLEKSLREMSRRKMRRQWEWFSLFLRLCASEAPARCKIEACSGTAWASLLAELPLQCQAECPSQPSQDAQDESGPT